MIIGTKNFSCPHCANILTINYSINLPKEDLIKEFENMLKFEGKKLVELKPKK